MCTYKENLAYIEQYYAESQKAFYNWGLDHNRPGIYALHLGYKETGNPKDHHTSVKKMTAEVINEAEIKDGQRVLDAGCGTGAITFEIAERFPLCEVHGINISEAQLRVAQQFKIDSYSSNTLFSKQDYINTAFINGSFDRIVCCESLSHAFNKMSLLNEISRLLCSSGRVTIADIFYYRYIQNLEEERVVRQLEEGLSLPNIPTIDAFSRLMQQEGLKTVTKRDLTADVRTSVEVMGADAERKTKATPPSNRVYDRGRLAYVATKDLFKAGVLGYFIISAVKDSD